GHRDGGQDGHAGGSRGRVVGCPTLIVGGRRNECQNDEESESERILDKKVQIPTMVKETRGTWREAGMKITAQEEYGLRCLLCLARAYGGQPLTIPEIAASENLSQPYVGKLLAVLRQAR